VSDAPYLLDATKRNLVEANVFELTLGSDQSHDYNAIQYAGQRGIVRGNVFLGNQGGGLGFQVYPDEALFNYGHRAYNNTFFNNRCYGIIASADSDPTQYFDNLVRNSILYMNLGCAGEPEQTSIGNPTAVALADNAILDAPPLFVDEAQGDLHLQEDSPMIDAGAFLTRAVGAGSGTALQVEDAAYFFDGHAIPGEQGDLIQLEGSTETARVIAVDVDGNVLTLSSPLSWTDQQGVALSYTGSAPDMGAFEHGLGPVGSGAGGGGGGGAGGPGAGGGDGGAGDNGGAAGAGGGCGCRAGSGAAAAWPAAIALALAFAARRRRREERAA
jgi:MYXO-CTERM domain-containing protein